MTLLFVSESRGWSGGVNQILLTACELRRRGHRVVLALRPGGVPLEEARVRGLEVIPLAMRQDYDVPAAIRLRRACTAIGADLIHAHHPKAHAVAVVAAHLGLSSPPVVVTRRVVSRVSDNPFSRWKYRSRRVARYVAVCRAAKAGLVAAGVGADRVEVVPSAVEVGRFAEAWRRRQDLPPSPPFRIGLVGNSSWRRGHEVMLDAIPRILGRYPDTRIAFVGRGTERLRPLAEARGISSAIDLLGERRDVPDILAGLHLFVMPSVEEGIATALIEAQCAGVPCVASDTGGIPDVVVHDETGVLVPAGDSGRLAEAVLALLEKPDRSATLAANGRTRALREFGLEHLVGRLEAVYEDCIGRRSRR